MLRECFMAGLKISKLQGFVLKSMQGWLDGKVIFPIQMLPTFGGPCNRYFWDVRLKIFRLPNFNMLFQLVLTTLRCFRIYRKWSRDQVMQRASVGRPCCVSRGKTLFTILIRRNIFLTGEKKISFAPLRMKVYSTAFHWVHNKTNFKLNKFQYPSSKPKSRFDPNRVHSSKGFVKLKSPCDTDFHEDTKSQNPFF